MIELQVFKYNDPTLFLGILPIRFQPQFLTQLKATGSGSFMIPLDRAQKQWELLDYRNLVKIVIDEVVIGGFLIGKQKATTITIDEKPQEMIEVIGEGCKIWLDDATVKPETGLDPLSGDTRSFNFSSMQSDWYNPAAWINPTIVGSAHDAASPWGIYPKTFPSNSGAKWIWVEPFNTDAGKATCYFRFTYNVTIPGQYCIYAACDNYISIWVDGELLATSDEKDMTSWHEATKVIVPLTVGTHVIAFTGRNETHPGFNPAGLIMALMRWEGDTEYHVAASGSGSWKCLPYPATAPGWTPGNVLLQLLNEAEARGVLFPSWFTPTFTSVLDSNGVAWPQSLDWTYDVEESLLSVVSKLEETGMDFWFDLDTMEINAVAQRGVNRTEFPTTLQEVRRNLVDSPGFENGTGGLSVNGLPSSTSSYPSDGGWQGTRYNRRTFTATGSSVTGGLQFDATSAAAAAAGKVWAVGLPVSASIYVRPSVAQTFTARFEYVSGGGTSFNGPLVEAPANVWTRVGGTTTVPSLVTTAVRFIARAVTGGVGSHIWATGETLDSDGALVEFTDTVGTWFSGNDPDTATEFYSWQSTANASDSILSMMLPDVTGDPPIVFQRGENLRHAELEGVGKIRNALGIRTESGWLEEEDAASIALYGRVETKLDTNASTELSQALAQIIFNQRATPEEGASYEVIIGSKFTPFVDFNEGDWVLAPNKDNQLVPRRVVSIAVEEGEAGEALYTLEFDTVFQTYEEKVANFINKSTGGGAGAGLSNSSTTTPPGSGPIVIPPAPLPALVPAAPTAVNATSVGTWSANGVYATSKVTLTWTAVTLNTNGTPATIPEYQVWGYPTLLGPAGDKHLTTVTGTTAEINGLTPAEAWTFRVRAINNSGAPGDWSANVAHTPVGPTTPMLAPVAPTLATELGLLVVNWTGKLNNGGSPVDPPNYFRYAYASVATSSGGTYTRMGPAFSRGGGSITIPGLTVGTPYWVKLTAVDGIGIESPASASATITITGVALGDLDASIGAAIDAAEEAAYDAREVTNMLNDSSFELNVEDWWDLLNAKATFSTTSPRTGTRSLRMVAATSSTRFAQYTRPIQVNDGDMIYLDAWIREVSAGTGIDSAIQIGVDYGATEALGSSVIVAISPTVTTSYRSFGGDWLVPSTARFIRPYIQMTDTDNTTVYLMDDIRLRVMTSNTMIIDGAITADKIAAAAVVANHIAANAVTAVAIQAGAITAEKMAADSVTANSIAAGAVTADHITAGAIEVSHLSPSIGGEIDISANDSINFVVGLVETVEGSQNETQQSLEEMQTYYTFGAAGAVVSTPASPFAVAIRNDRIEMLENGNVVSYWNAGQMVVSQFVGEQVILGNHKLEKYSDGTVVRAL